MNWLQILSNYLYVLFIYVKVLALVSRPELLEDSCYPEDTKERARTILDGCRGGSVGNYFL